MVKLHNTLSRKKETLRTKSGRRISLFVCGPTVYDYSHIGHARTYISFDSFVRFLRFKGYKVDYLQNITDIDDKIIQRAKEKNLSVQSLARMFEKEYQKDMKSLGIQSVTKYARATNHIPEIISQVQRLLKKGYAYEVKGDGIYYNISKFKDYGKLSHRTSLEAEDSVSRIDNSVQKQNKGDFALWKISKKDEPKWKSPFGWGRPGWHIEDTSITEKRFGVQYELHGGARDLIFPHHEAEIAQMEAISGKKPLARHWMHSGFLTSKGEKMAKSLGNFITIQSFLQDHSPRILRLLVLKTHYRSPIDYSEKLLLQTERELERIDEFIDRVKTQKKKGKASFSIQKFQQAFTRALEDDFNTPKAIAVLFDLLNKGNQSLKKDTLSVKDAQAVLSFLKSADEILGFIFFAKKKVVVPQNIMKLTEEREGYRKKKEWKKADEIRTRLLKAGWNIEDTANGYKIKSIK